VLSDARGSSFFSPSAYPWVSRSRFLRVVAVWTVSRFVVWPISHLETCTAAHDEAVHQYSTMITYETRRTAKSMTTDRSAGVRRRRERLQRPLRRYRFRANTAQRTITILIIYSYKKKTNGLQEISAERIFFYRPANCPYDFFRVCPVSCFFCEINVM